jgi:hypothetical protein
VEKVKTIFVPFAFFPPLSPQRCDNFIHYNFVDSRQKNGTSTAGFAILKVFNISVLKFMWNTVKQQEIILRDDFTVTC